MDIFYKTYQKYAAKSIIIVLFELRLLATYFFFHKTSDYIKLIIPITIYYKLLLLYIRINV